MNTFSRKDLILLFMSINVFAVVSLSDPKEDDIHVYYAKLSILFYFSISSVMSCLCI